MKQKYRANMPKQNVGTKERQRKKSLKKTREIYEFAKYIDSE